MELKRIVKCMAELEIVAFLLQLCVSPKCVEAISNTSPFMKKEEAKSFLAPTAARTNRVLTSALGMASDSGNGWEEIRELEKQSPRLSNIQQLEQAVLHSHLPQSEKSAILEKLAMGSLIGLGNLAEKLLTFRAKGLNLQQSLG